MGIFDATLFLCARNNPVGNALFSLALDSIWRLKSKRHKYIK